jgi:hypothetical protein
MTKQYQVEVKNKEGLWEEWIFRRGDIEEVKAAVQKTANEYGREARVWIGADVFTFRPNIGP